MKYLKIQEALDRKQGEVSIRAWVYRKREQKDYVFITIRDETGIIQIIIDKQKVEEKQYQTAKELGIESSIIISGKIKEEKRSPQGYEIEVDSLEVVGPSDNYPISKDFSEEFLLDVRHLWLRSRKMTAILKIRSTVVGAIHEYFRKEGFYEYQSPVLQSVQCEGGSTLFKVDYFGEKDVFLAQTWQLYAEPAIFSLGKIYTVAPSFRAEKSKTSRHLTEYWHAEMEGTWIDFEQLQDHGEALIKYVVSKVLEERKQELEILKRDITKLQTAISKPFVRITYDDALKILKEKEGMDIEWGKDLRTIEEDKLSKLYDTFIIVTRYPKQVKAFYMKEDPKNKKVVLGFDCIGPEGYGEIIGASERESDLEQIKQRLTEQGEDSKQYDFYLDTRRYGSVPHAGFGLGVERLITYITGLDNIKDAIPFPRTITRYKP
jgi:asparaginyl-tRNA synthetase